MENKLRVLILFVILLLAGCSTGSQAGSTPGQTSSNSSLPDVSPTPRATQPAVLALSTYMPSFEGLYFTPDLSIDIHDTSARVLAGIPCSQVVALISSGEWRQTKNIPVNPAFGGLIPGITLMERNGEYLLLKSKDIIPEVSATPGEEQTVTATPTLQVTSGAIDYGNLVGCQVTIGRIIPQPIEAHGVEEVKGMAFGFPLVGDCLSSADQSQVNMFYEGPGNFRAILKFDTPKSLGEHPLITSELNLQIMHFPESVLDFIDQYLSQWKPGDTNSLDSQGTAFSAGSESPGKVTVRSLSPLTGEIQLDNMVDPSGSPQTFKASFNCGW